jgi:hypothetical protein
MARGKDLQPRKRRPCLPIAERLARFTDKSGGPDACWPWTGGTVGNGYGVMASAHRATTAHRVAYALHVGPIPAGLWVLHRCDNPRCVNPAHLFVGTPHENVVDMLRKGRGRAGTRTPLRGEANPSSKLTAAQVLEIRAQHGQGASYPVLAARFGCSYSTVEKVCARRLWAHL